MERLYHWLAQCEWLNSIHPLVSLIIYISIALISVLIGTLLVIMLLWVFMVVYALVMGWIILIIYGGREQIYWDEGTAEWPCTKAKNGKLIFIGILPFVAQLFIKNGLKHKSKY